LNGKLKKHFANGVVIASSEYLDTKGKENIVPIEFSQVQLESYVCTTMYKIEESY
jgi:hypothetical protein